MDTMDLDRMIADIANQVMVNPKSGARLLQDGEREWGVKAPLAAVYFRVQCRADNHGYENDGSTYHPEWVRTYHRTIHILVSERHNVFVCQTTDTDPSIPSIDKWENTSNHDSCWSSDGLRVFRNWAMDAYDHCWAHVPKQHQIKPKDLSVFNTFDWFSGGRAFHFVKLTRNSAIDYRYALTSVTPMDYEITLKDKDTGKENAQ